MDLLTDSHKEKICEIFSCFDRLIFRGAMPLILYAQGMASYLYSNNIRILDYSKFDTIRFILVNYNEAPDFINDSIAFGEYDSDLNTNSESINSGSLDLI